MLYDTEGNHRLKTDKVQLSSLDLLNDKPVILQTD
jgi:hypothetical protein